MPPQAKNPRYGPASSGLVQGQGQKKKNENIQQRILSSFITISLRVSIMSERSYYSLPDHSSMIQGSRVFCSQASYFLLRLSRALYSTMIKNAGNSAFSVSALVAHSINNKKKTETDVDRLMQESSFNNSSWSLFIYRKHNNDIRT